MTEPQWKLYVRDSAFNRIGEIDDYQTLEIYLKFNDVGTWTLDLDNRVPLAQYLAMPGYGIELIKDDSAVILAGPTMNRIRKKTLTANRLQLAGVDDNVWLARRLISPQPATAVAPYSVSATDTRTGVCSTILGTYVNLNLGPGAVTPRQVTPTLSLAADPVVGGTVTGVGQWDVMLPFLQALATAGGAGLPGGVVGFDLSQSGSGLLFSTYAPVDRSAIVQFSEEFGNLAEFTYESDAPVANYIYVGGSGTAPARTIVEGQDGAKVAAWGRIEAFDSFTNSNDVPTMTGEIATALAANSDKQSLAITPIDVPGQAYATNYNLGDMITIVIDGVPVVEVVQQVHLTFTPAGPQNVAPIIGTPGSGSILGVFKKVSDMTRRIQNLETRR